MLAGRMPRQRHQESVLGGRTEVESGCQKRPINRSPVDTIAVTDEREMKTHHFLLSLFAAVLLNGPAFAEKAPLSLRDLQKQADLIVVATVERIRVESEPSRFEPAFGNADWGIYLTLRLETVEQGNVSHDELEARCFRIRHRRSVTEYLTPSGHDPIPATGTRVRVYLEKMDSTWLVVLPNGIVPVDGDAQDAIEVTQLGGRRYTYVLPLELWTLLIIVGIPLGIGFALVVRWYRRRQLPQRRTGVAGQSHAPESAAEPVTNGEPSPPAR